MEKSEKIRSIVEIVGLLAVVLSLIFVGFEIRQNTLATRSATQQAIYEGGIQSNLNVMNNQRLREVFVESSSDPDWITTAPGEDYILLRRFYLNRFNNLENAYYHFKAGTYDAELWAGQEGWITSLLDDSMMLHFWNLDRNAFMTGFRDYMDARYRQVGAPITDN